MKITLDYPGTSPGPTSRQLSSDSVTLQNAALHAEWFLVDGKPDSLTVLNVATGQKQVFSSACLPTLTIGGHRVDLRTQEPLKPLEAGRDSFTIFPESPEPSVEITLKVELGDNANALIFSLSLTTSKEVEIQDLTFLDSTMVGFSQMGEVLGSVVVGTSIFLGIENPLARNEVQGEDVSCKLPLKNLLKPESPWTQTFAIGVVPDQQLRRGFAYYIDQRRAHPYRHFLHYNNWYDVWLAKPVDQRSTEQECEDAIKYFGKELVEKRNVKFDAVVWDDGWDDYEKSLWEFHSGFPNGFRNLMKTAEPYGISQGVWMSPKGGYAYAQEARIQHCEPLGYETNQSGFSMGGPVYSEAFKKICIDMIRNNGVVFFKFDGMGDGGHDTGKEVKLSDDINGVLDVCHTLRKEKEDVYISATAGTWASPYWLLFADSIWRQGGDSGSHGEGDTRQQWITYRDMYVHNRIVQAGPLYPINSLMLHGILISEGRPSRAPSNFINDEKSVADEIWTYFGSGTCLQELYITPNVMSDTMLDHLGEAANWARANQDLLIDTHWIGGNPEVAEVYGWASWKPDQKGLLVLRNPSTQTQTFNTTLNEALEFYEGKERAMKARALYPKGRILPQGQIDPHQKLEFTLEPWESIVVEFTP